MRGTVLVGLGIAIGNVLLPSLIKDKFPRKVGLMTSVYSTAMAIFAALASGLSIPLAEGLNLGWQGSLAYWAILTAVAVVLWIPQLRQQKKPIQQQKDKSLQQNSGVHLLLGKLPFLWDCNP